MATGNLRQRLFKKSTVGRYAGLISVCPIGKQGKLGVDFPAGQPVQAKALGQCFCRSARCQHARHDHQNTVFRRNTI